MKLVTIWAIWGAERAARKDRERSMTDSKKWLKASASGRYLMFIATKAMQSIVVTTLRQLLSWICAPPHQKILFMKQRWVVKNATCVNARTRKNRLYIDTPSQNLRSERNPLEKTLRIRFWGPLILVSSRQTVSMTTMMTNGIGMSTRRNTSQPYCQFW